MTAIPLENAGDGEPIDKISISRRTWVACVLLLVFSGFALRGAYAFNGYRQGGGDETITAGVVQHLRSSGDWDTNWAKSDNRDFHYDQYNFSSYLYATYFFYSLTKLVPGTTEWRSLEQGFYVYRLFSVLLASLSVWQTIRLAERLGGRLIALVAGSLTVVSVLLVQDAHFCRPEPFTTVGMLAVVGLCFSTKNKAPGTPAILGASLLVGILVACKVSMLLIAWVPFVPLLTFRTRARAVLMIAVPLAISSGFALGSPGAVLHPTAFLNGVRHLTAQYAGLHPPHSHFKGGPVGDMLLKYFATTLGLPVCLSFFFGLVVLARRSAWREIILIVGPIVVFVGYFSSRSVFFERNLSHVLPLMEVVAAIGAVAAGRKVYSALSQKNFIPLSIAMGALLLFRSITLTAPLLWIEFSGRGSERHNTFNSALQAEYPQADWLETNLVNNLPIDKLSDHFHTAPSPMLVDVSDYGDEWTTVYLEELRARFVLKVVADYPETFPGIPVSTLQTYHSPHHRYYLITGLRRS